MTCFLSKVEWLTPLSRVQFTAFSKINWTITPTALKCFWWLFKACYPAKILQISLFRALHVRLKPMTSKDNGNNFIFIYDCRYMDTRVCLKANWADPFQESRDFRLIVVFRQCYLGCRMPRIFSSNQGSTPCLWLHTLPRTEPFVSGSRFLLLADGTDTKMASINAANFVYNTQHSTWQSFRNGNVSFCKE